MKRLLLFISFILLLTKLCFADVSFEIIAQDIDDNGNIRIWACHKIDDMEVESNYPKIDGHFVYCTRYSKQNFKDCKNKKEIEDYILNDIKNYSDVLIQKEFDKNAPKTLNQIRVDYNTLANQVFMTANLDKLIGKSLLVAQVSMIFDTDNDGAQDKEITIKPDGTKTEAVITP